MCPAITVVNLPNAVFNRSVARTNHRGHRHNASGKRSVLLAILVSTVAACGGDVALPKPAPNTPRKEQDDWVKPGRNVRLKAGVGPGLRANTIRITNVETFDWTLVDDVWLRISAPNAQVRRNGPYIGDGRNGWYVYLRCPAPRSIPAGSAIEISFDACSITTYEPGPGARVKGVHVAAREGVFDTNIDFGPEVLRRGG
jgi:hypothetical protein